MSDGREQGVRMRLRPLYPGRRIAWIRQHRDLDELNGAWRQAMQLFGDREEPAGGHLAVSGNVAMADDVRDHPQDFRRTARQPAPSDALQKRCHQVLVAANALKVRARTDVARSPERQRFPAIDVMPARTQVEQAIRVVDRDGKADADPANVIDHVFEAGERKRDEVVDVDSRRLLDCLPEAARTAVSKRSVNLLDVSRGLGRLTKRTVLWCALHDGDYGISREAKHDQLAGPRTDMKDHDGV